MFFVETQFFGHTLSMDTKQNPGLITAHKTTTLLHEFFTQNEVFRIHHNTFAAQQLRLLTNKN